MALSFAAIVPHSPLFVPNIGKENISLFKQTLSAAAGLAESFKETTPDLVIVLTSQGPRRQTGFVINTNTHFKADLSAFGDLVTAWEHEGSIAAPARLREHLEDRASLRLTTAPLDYASAIALNLVGAPERLPVMTLTSSGQSLQDHFNFGRLLQEFVINEKKSIALIASADLSHRLNKKSPAGYSAKAKKLEQKILDCLTRHDYREILTISQAAVEDAAIEDLGVIAIFLGCLDGFATTPRLLSYEAPFGIGHPLLHYPIS